MRFSMYTECDPKSYDLYMLGIFGGAVKHRTATLTNDFQRHDFSTDDWYQVDNLMEGNQRTRIAVTTFKNEMWVLGGCMEKANRVSLYESSVYVYHHLKSSDRWSPRRSMTRRRADFCAAAVGDRLFAIGGEGTQSTSTVDTVVRKTVEELKASGVWRAAPAMSYARSLFACCVNNDKIYVTGGVPSEHGFHSAIECYDTATDRWTDLTYLPMCFRKPLRLAYENNNLYVVGNDLSIVRYDLAERLLTPQMAPSQDPCELDFFAVFTLNGELYVIGRTATSTTKFQKCRPPDYTWMRQPPPLIPWESDYMGIALIKLRTLFRQSVHVKWIV